MMTIYSLPGYDAWKTSYPPWYDDVGHECPACHEWINDEDSPEDALCGWCEEQVVDEKIEERD